MIQTEGTVCPIAMFDYWRGGKIIGERLMLKAMYTIGYELSTVDHYQPWQSVPSINHQPEISVDHV